MRRSLQFKQKDKIQNKLVGRVLQSRENKKHPVFLGAIFASETCNLKDFSLAMSAQRIITLHCPGFCLLDSF